MNINRRRWRAALAWLWLALFSLPAVAWAQLSIPITGFAIIPSNAVTVIFTNTFVTNVFVTQIVDYQPGTLVPLASNLIDPRLGRRFVKTITATTGLTIVPNFPDTNFATLYVVNPNRFPVFWPSTNQVLYRGGKPPDPTDPFPIVLFESILGRIIATQ